MSCRDQPPTPAVLTLPAEVDAMLLAADGIVGRVDRPGLALVFISSPLCRPGKLMRYKKVRCC
jgi:hypothetical protein